MRRWRAAGTRCASPRVTRTALSSCLRAFDLPCQQISRQKSGSVGLAVEMAQRTPRLMKIMRSFKPDVMTGIMGPSIALAGALRRVPAVVFYDTEFAVQTNRLVYPLAHSVCTPDCYQGKVPGRHLQYAGYHELAYLHPNRFRPDPAVLAGFGVSPDEPYSIVRFVSWQAVHDRQERGLSAKQKRHLVETLQRRGRVLISSEAPLTPGPRGPRCPRARGADPPPDRPREARGGRVGNDVLGGRSAGGSRGVHSDDRTRLHRRRGAAVRARAALHRGPVRYGAVRDRGDTRAARIRASRQRGSVCSTRRLT